MQTAKALLDKANADKKDPYLCVLEYRNTLVDNYKSPAQLLMSHRLCSVLPNTNQQLQPEVVSYKEGYEKWLQRQQHQKKCFDRSSTLLSPLHSGDSIRLQEQDYWKPAVILQPATTACSHIPHTQDGQGQSDNNTSSAEEAEAEHEEDNASENTPERHTTGNTSHTHDTH